MYGILRVDWSQVATGKCTAEFLINDRVTDGRVLPSGELQFKSIMQSRQLMFRRGKPPFMHGFNVSQALNNHRDFENTFPVSATASGTLAGTYRRREGGVIASEAAVELRRS